MKQILYPTPFDNSVILNLHNYGLQFGGSSGPFCPTVEIDGVVLDSGPTPEEAVCDVDLKLIFGANSQQSSQIYSNKKYTQDTRIRVVLCTNANFCQDNLDYFSSQMNSYMEGKMNIFGSRTGVQSFYDQAAFQNLSGFHDVLGSGGVFDTDVLTRDLKNKKLFYFNMPDISSGLYLYDAPLENVLMRNSNGTPITYTSKDEIFVRPADLTSDAYSIPKIITNLNKVRFKVPIVGEGSPQLHLSVYAFVYNDYDAFIQQTMNKPSKEKNLSKTSQDIESPLQTGIGYITSLTAIGQKKHFTTGGTETRGVSPTSPFLLEEDRNKDLFSNRVAIKRLSTTQVVDNLTQGFYESMASLSRWNTIDREPSTGTAAIIKFKNYFSDLWLSKDSNENLYYSFSFDKQAYFRDHSLFPRLYMNPKTSAELLRGSNLFGPGEERVGQFSKIVDIKMIRRRVYKDRFGADNNLGTILRKNPYEQTYYEKEEIIDSPRNFSVDVVNSGIDFYQGHDDLKDEISSQSPAVYQYGVTFYLQESSLKYLASLVKSCDKNIGQSENLLGFYESDTRRRFFNQQTRKKLIPFDQVRLNSIGLRGDDVVEDLIQSYMTLVEVAASNAQTQGLLNDLRNYVNQKDLNNFINIVNKTKDMRNKIAEFIGVRLPGETFESEQNNKDPMTAAICHRKYNLQEVTHYFDNLVTPSKDYKTGYEYLPSKAASLPVLKKSELEKRAADEFKKYFEKYREEPEDGEEDPVEDIGPIASTFSSSSYAYFSPSHIHLYGQKSVEQLSYKNPLDNQVEYDLDRYASLLLGLFHKKSIGQYYLEPDERKDGDSQIQKIYNSLFDQFAKLDCVIVDDDIDASNVFPKLKTTNYKEINTTGIQSSCADKKITTQPNLFPMIFGGIGDLSPDAISYYSSADYKLLNTEFTDKTQEEEVKTKELKNRPIKLAFSILGEMEFSVEPFTKVAEMISVNQKNSVKLINGPLKNIPNQTKSMLVVTKNQKKEDFFDGLDAVRNVFVHSSSGGNNISGIPKGGDFPPYKMIQDPTQLYSQLTAFWMNYQQLGVIEYLERFEFNSSPSFIRKFTKQNVSPFNLGRKKPVWKKLSKSVVDALGNKRLLCRIRPIGERDNFSFSESSSEEAASIKFRTPELFNLPIYNAYFILRE